MLDRQEESGKVAHLAGRKPIFATKYTNVIQIIVLDYIRLIGRQNWITFGPNECGGKEGSYTIKKPSAKGVAAAAVAAVRPTVRSRSRRNRSRRPSAGRPLQIHERLDTLALGFVVVSFPKASAKGSRCVRNLVTIPGKSCTIV